MESYPSYKVSGVEWIGDIPSHWDKKSLRYSFDIQKGKIPKILLEESGENLLPYLSTGVLRTGIVNEYCDKTEGVLVEEGDLLILWDGSKSGEIFLGKVGILSSTMSKMDLYDEKLDRGFTFYLMKYYEKDFKNNTIGMGIPHMDGNHLKSSRIIIPPLSEQSQIVSFLDNKTQKIDDLIQKTEKKIELLKEKRTSLINHCVTKGLNPNVEMKDSGVEWIGDIPSQWKSIKLKYFGFLFGGLSGKSGKDFNNEENPNNKPFIPFTNICDNTYISKDNMGMVSISEDDKQNCVEKNDLFFLMSSEDQEGIGKPSVLKDDLGEVYLNTFCKGFRITDEKYNSLFVNYLLSGHSYRELLSVEGNGFTRINLRSHKVSNFQIHYPPKGEQSQIVEYLDEQTQKIDSTIEKETQRIELLKEYHQSLISEVVTGKVDVREWTE